MKFQSRSAFGWGTSAAAYATPRKGLVIHYDGSNQGLAGKAHSSCVAYWKSTRRFHTGPARGWADIGYSFGACPHGYVMEGRGLGRIQAAQPGGNDTWYSVTLMSGPGEDPTPAQIDAVRQLRQWLMGKGVAGAVRGHRDFISTSCPGDRLYRLVTSGTFSKAPSEEDDDMQLSDKVRIKDWVRKRWPKDTGLADGEISVNTALGSGYAYSRIAADTSGQVLALLKSVADRVGAPVEVDADAVAQAVLAQLTPERIAAAIPAELAEQVVSALGARLTPKENA